MSPPLGPVGRRRTLILVLGVTCASALVFLGYFAASRHFAVMNSDNATLVLEGQAMSTTSFILHGWALALDSFWTSEAPWYALGSALGVPLHVMLFAMPALVALLVLGVAGWLATSGATGCARFAALGVVVCLLGLPSPALSFFLLQGSWHVGTALLCLVAFGALSRRSLFAFALGVLALCLALLGDLQAFAYGVVPLVGAGIVASLRQRRLAGGGRLVLAAVLAPLFALAARSLARLAGAFQIVNANPTARWSEMLANLRRLPAREAGLFGVTALPVHSATGEVPLSALVHVLLLVIAVAAVLAALAGLALAAFRGPARPVASGLLRGQLATGPLDDLLVIALCCDLADFVGLAGTGNGNYVRYLTPSVCFTAALAGRFAARFVEARPRAARPVLAVVTTLLISAGASFAFSFTRPAVSDPTVALRNLLAARHLTEGLGDYWSASIVTVESDSKVTVRPVIADPQGRLVRYGRQSSSQWYAGRRFNFVVYDRAHPWRGVDAASATLTFGEPAALYSAGSYQVFVLAHGVEISPVGFSHGSPLVGAVDRSGAPSLTSTQEPHGRALQGPRRDRSGS